MQVTEQEPKGVAQLAVVVGDTLHQVFARRNILPEVHRCDPEPHNLAAKALRDVDRIDAIAERFGKGAALLIERPARGGDHAIRRDIAQRATEDNSEEWNQPRC